MLGAALAVSAPLVLADEKSWLHMPSFDEFRAQAISRAPNERDWPFAVDAGTLLCAYVLGQPVVYFAEKVPDGDPAAPRVTVVSTNPLDLMVGTFGGESLYAPGRKIEELIVAVAPYEQAGARLCQQRPGAEVGPGEL